jgi:hypothetical protein
MANTIDVKGAIVNITSSKAVKFDKMMGSTGGAGGQGKSAKFSDKGEYKNLGKFVVLMGQSLKKMNVNLLQTKKEITGFRKENSEKLTAIATAIGDQRAELKSFAKSQKKANKTLKDLAGKVGTSLELDKIRNKGALEDRKERRRDRAERRRADRESALERSRKAIGGVGKGLGKLAKGGKNFLETIMDFLGIGGFIASVVTAFTGYQILKKALNSNFVKNTVKGFMEGMQNLIAGIQAIPEGAFDKIGNALGGIAKFLGGALGKTIENVGKFIDGIPQATLDKFGKFFGNVFKFVSAFVGDRFKEVFNGLDKLIDKDGNLKFDLGGIVNLITGIGGLALAYRYIKNPTKIIDDVGRVLGFFGGLVGQVGGRIPGPIGGILGKFGKLGSNPGNPMYVKVVGGGLGDGLGDGMMPRGPGIRPKGKFTAPRGSGLNTGGSRLSRLMRSPGNLGMARPGNIINQTTGAATRMLGGNKAVDVAKQLKDAGASKGIRKAVLSGRMTTQQGLDIAAKGGPGFVQNARGFFSQAGNLGRGLFARAKDFGGGLLSKAMALPGNAVNMAKGVGGKLQDLGGSAVSGMKSQWDKMGQGLANLNPSQVLKKIQNGVGSKIDDLMKAEPLIAAFKGLKDPKNIKSLVKKVATKVKPALGAAKDAKKALGPFKIPGIDVLIGTLAAVVEIATGGHAGNAILGSLGGVLGAAAGTSIGALGGPPGVFIGSIAGGVLGEVAGRALARGLGAILPPEVSGFTGINGTPLFYTGTEKEGGEDAPVKKARGGKIFGGKPTGDSVPAYLERGEYVLNRKAVSAIGPSNLDAMNFGMFPRFQTGGKVSRQEGWDKFTQWGKEKGAKYPQLVSAQWALESGWGTALSAKNNFFGIKATSSESSANHRTREVVNGKSVYVNANFKNFDTPQDAVDHLVTQWYKNYKSYKGVNNAGSPNEAAAMLKSEGYATDPSYPQKLIELMQSKGVSSGPAYISGDGNSTSGSSAEPNRSGGFMSNLVGFMQRGGRAGGGRMPDDGKKTANTSGSTTPSAGDMNAEGSGKVIVNAAKAAVKKGKRGYASPPCASWVRTVLNATKHSSAKKFTRKADLDPQIGPESAWAQSLESAASFAGSDMGKVIRSQSALKPGDIVLHKNTFGNFGEGAITHVSIASDKKGKILHQSTSGGAPHETNMFKFAAGIRLGGTGSEGEFSDSDSDTTGPGGSTPGAATAENNYGFLGQQEVLASGGITSQKNISAMTKGIMALAGDVSKAGGGGIFGGALGGAIQPAPPTGSSNPPNPVSSNQSSANPTSGGGLSLSSTSTVNRNNEAKGDMR